MSQSRRSLSVVVLSVVVGATFVFAAVGKVLRPDLEGTILGDMIVGDSQQALLLVAVLEFGAGGALALGIWPRCVGLLGSIALAGGLVLLVIDQVGGGRRPCGCIGEVEHGVLVGGFWLSVARSFALIVTLLYIASGGARPVKR